ncbi:hypothetical protein EYF80_056268 [Liparis tanakae]|uniref:Uncharacterized protein n=1 Tax=Liparis tanakae TaxID=230148 RepID=A0A4Z2EYA5_9TELE|nr:hypothetical protein EYF80_056268 [Liparis tanakae]
MSCHGILGVVYLSMKSAQRGEGRNNKNGRDAEKMGGKEHGGVREFGSGGGGGRIKGSLSPVLSTLLTLSACCSVCLCRCRYRLKRALRLRPIPFSLGRSAESPGGVPRPLLSETPSTKVTPLPDGALAAPAWESGGKSGRLVILEAAVLIERVPTCSRATERVTLPTSVSRCSRSSQRPYARSIPPTKATDWSTTTIFS